MTKAIESRGARDIAKRSLETTGQVFRYAIAHGYCKRNPATEIRPSDILKSVRKVNYARIDAKELPALLRAMEVYSGTAVTRLAMKMMALTFVRTSELIGARWEEFDIKAKRWDIPAPASGATSLCSCARSSPEACWKLWRSLHPSDAQHLQGRTGTWELGATMRPQR